MSMGSLPNRRAQNSGMSSGSRSPRTPARRRIVTVECLEKRAMLSAAVLPGISVIHRDIVAASSSPKVAAKAVSTIHAADLGGVYNGKTFPATGFVAGNGGAHIATPVFSYYLATDKTFSHPLGGAPSNGGSYMFLAKFAGNSSYLPTLTSAPFTISKALPTAIHATDLGGVYDGKKFPATGFVTGNGERPYCHAPLHLLSRQRQDLQPPPARRARKCRQLRLRRELCRKQQLSSDFHLGRIHHRPGGNGHSRRRPWRRL